jgi:sec-independent protein translocase protein TatB
MFGIGPTELIVLLVLALIVVGPERLPQMAGQIGKAIRDFRQMSGDVTGEFQRAFQLDDLDRPPTPVMTDEVIAPTATPNGAAVAVPELSSQVIPSDSPIEPPAAIEESAAAATDTANFVPATPPMATKEEPLAGVSFLDEPEPAPAPATTAHESMAVASFSMPPIEEPVIAADPVADAWDAVMNTDATISLPEPSAAELQAASVGTAVALAEPEADREEETATGVVFTEPEPRPRIDPTAEVTIREVIEGQVAAEAFRERRRIAKYQRHK